MTRKPTQRAVAAVLVMILGASLVGMAAADRMVGKVVSPDPHPPLVLMRR